VDRVLIAGVESVVGANLAACFSDRCDVRGVSFARSAPLAACETSVCPPRDVDAVRGTIAANQPSWLFYCGPASRSTWSGLSPDECDSTLSAAVRIWAQAAEQMNCRFALISSDAVFTGPWMFHREECTGHCPSAAAQELRAAEEAALRAAPSALVVRTNAYGWSPASAGSGWIEEILSGLASGTAGPFDCLRHATPILATDLAEVLAQACHAGLSGVYHAAGAERTNPARFVEALAEVFDLPAPRSPSVSSLSERPTGFGRGETSLYTRKIRRALGISLPLLSDGLGRLRAQQVSGYCDLLANPGRPLRDKVA